MSLFLHELFYALSQISWRDENVVHAHILLFEWIADCVVFRFVKSKGNQTGNSNQEWHVYANPHNPEICAVLALACYIFSNPGIFSAADVEEDEGVEVEGGGAGNEMRKRGHYSLGGISMTDSLSACTILWKNTPKCS